MLSCLLQCFTCWPDTGCEPLKTYDRLVRNLSPPHRTLPQQDPMPHYALLLFNAAILCCIR